MTPAPGEDRPLPLEHDKRCMCSDPALHRLKWTNWKLVQAEQEIAALNEGMRDNQAEIVKLATALERIADTQPNNDPVVWAIIVAAREALDL